MRDRWCPRRFTASATHPCDFNITLVGLRPAHIPSDFFCVRIFVRKRRHDGAARVQHHRACLRILFHCDPAPQTRTAPKPSRHPTTPPATQPRLVPPPPAARRRPTTQHAAHTRRRVADAQSLPRHPRSATTAARRRCAAPARTSRIRAATLRVKRGFAHRQVLRCRRLPRAARAWRNSCPRLPFARTSPLARTRFELAACELAVPIRCR